MRIVHMHFIPSRSAGLKALAEFLPRAGRDYAARRNFDFGPDAHNNVSCLSPYTRTRLVTEREIVTATLKQYSAPQAEKFIQEVFWRTYFKGRLEREPHIWTQYCQALETLLPRAEKGGRLGNLYDKAITGQTGIEGFDHWARELVSRNYLHNHARMWFASIWIFTLDLPWQLGADFFMQHLLDGDPASNTLSWRWVGGLHTKGKTYLARPDNIEKFTAGRFRPEFLAGDAPPLQEPDNEHPPRPVPDSDSLPDGPYLWLKHEDDLAAPTGKPSVCGALMPTGYERSANAVSEFRKSSAAGAAPHNFRDADDIIAFCNQNKLTAIARPYAPVGPGAAQIAALTPALKDAGLGVHVIVRDWDRLTWPYATAGFFKVKKKIPHILDGLNQGRLL